MNEHTPMIATFLTGGVVMMSLVVNLDKLGLIIDKMVVYVME
jgi:hypothetical protein